jgi:hypothetical protein
VVGQERAVGVVADPGSEDEVALTILEPALVAA